MSRWGRVLIVLNLIDLVSTLAAVQLGFAWEVNPVMEGLLAFSPWAFALGKALWVTLLTVLVYDHQDDIGVWTGAAMKSVVCCYMAIVLWHAFSWAMEICYTV